VQQEFPDSPAAGWARREMQRIEKERKAPLRGKVKRMALPGVVSVARSRGREETTGAREADANEAD
jgi:hypothetical protein